MASSAGSPADRGGEPAGRPAGRVVAERTPRAPAPDARVRGRVARKGSIGNRTGLWWEALPEEALLDVRLGRLGLRVEGSPLQPRVEQLGQRARARGPAFPAERLALHRLVLAPRCSRLRGALLPGARPKLQRLERRNMFDAEGGSHSWCMKLLRHETGHALDTAYRLHRRKCWREHFGRASTPLTPRPTCRSPAVATTSTTSTTGTPRVTRSRISPRPSRCGWLLAGVGALRYRGWPALRKLEYVDALMRRDRQSAAARCAPAHAPIRCRACASPCATTTSARSATTGEEDYAIYDRDLRRLFGGVLRPWASFGVCLSARAPRRAAPARRQLDGAAALRRRRGVEGTHLAQP